MNLSNLVDIHPGVIKHSTILDYPIYNDKQFLSIILFVYNHFALSVYVFIGYDCDHDTLISITYYT